MYFDVEFVRKRGDLFQKMHFILIFHLFHVSVGNL
jgi:hypothetical protein